MLKQIMKRAHELARQMEGDYVARLSLALRQAWKEAKEVEETKLPELIGSEKQIKWAIDIRQKVQETVQKGIIKHLSEQGLHEDAETARKHLTLILENERRAAEWINEFGRFDGALLEGRFLRRIKMELKDKTLLRIYGVI